MILKLFEIPLSLLQSINPYVLHFCSFFSNLTGFPPEFILFHHVSNQFLSNSSLFLVISVFTLAMDYYAAYMYNGMENDNQENQNPEPDDQK